MSMIVSICQHCDEHELRKTAMCTLHDFLSSKVRYMHTSTVTKSHSCSENLRVRRVCILFGIAIVSSKNRVFFQDILHFESIQKKFHTS